MLTSSYLASCPDEIAKIYSRLESDILKLMAERIAKNIKGAKNISEWQMLVLVESGALREDIQRLIAKYDEAVRVEIMRLFDDAVRLSTENDIKYAGRNMSPGQRQQLESLAARLYHPEETNKDYYAMVKRYADDYAFNSIRRLTATIAATTERQFIAAANAAFMQVASGASDYDSAMKRACHELAGQGVYTVSYTESGRQVTHTIETAIRANIITGINQSAAQQTEINCQYLECDLVETSAHIGARNKDGPNEWSNHEEWQGSVFHLGSGREYMDGNGNKQFAPSFKASCGLGYADGICGINCRHSYYPYFEGTRQTFGMIDDEPIDIDGKKISRYDAEQKLRYYERGVRRWKREADMLAAVGMDNTRERMKIAEWQCKAKAWCDKTGLRRDYAREFIGTASGKQVYGLGRKIAVDGDANRTISAIPKLEKPTARQTM